MSNELLLNNIEQGNVRAIELLLKRGAALDDRLDNGMTPIQFAFEKIVEHEQSNPLAAQKYQKVFELLCAHRNENEIKPSIHTILDGFGLLPRYVEALKENPNIDWQQFHQETKDFEDVKNSAITPETSPYMFELISKYPHLALDASGASVGLVDGEFGNSQSGHRIHGAGRVIESLSAQIDRDMQQDTFITDELQKKFEQLKASGKSLHLMGVFGDGRIQGDIHHTIYIANKAAEMGIKVKVHAFTDGKNTHKSVQEILDLFKGELTSPDLVDIVTMGGRGKSMDMRFNHPEALKNAQETFELVTTGKCNQRISTVEKAISDFMGKPGYQVKNDLNMPEAVIGNYQGMEDGDIFFCTNYRSDGSRNLMEQFVKSDKISNDNLIAMGPYSSEISKSVAPLYQPNMIQNTMGEVIANAELSQIRIAQPKKRDHVTFFYDVERDMDYPNYTADIVAPEVGVGKNIIEKQINETNDTARKLVNSLETGKHDFAVVNFAAADVLGHKGNTEDAKVAVKQMDDRIKNMVQLLEAAGGISIISADHGNGETMREENGAECTRHSGNLVPTILVGKGIEKEQCKINQKSGLGLASVGPTLLHLMNKVLGKKVEIPQEMKDTPLLFSAEKARSEDATKQQKAAIGGRF